MSSISIPKTLQDDRLRFCRVKKGTKKPFELEWTKKPYTWQEIAKFIDENDENYGVLCGFGDLAVLDVDNQDFVHSVNAMFPPTYTVKTGSGGMHYYFFIPELKHKLILESGTLHLGEIQSWGSQCVCPTSIHPNGNRYEEFKVLPIATITMEQLYEWVLPFIKHIQEAKELSDEVKREYPSTYFENEPSVMDIWQPDGYKQRGGEYYGSHPIHGSEGGQNFWVNSLKGLWKCFRCDSGGDWWSAIAVKEGLINCSDAQKGAIRGDVAKRVLQIAQEKYGLKVKPNLDIANKVYERIEQKSKDRATACVPTGSVEQNKTPQASSIVTTITTVTTKENSFFMNTDDFNDLRNEVATALLTKDKKLATELIAMAIENRRKIYTTKEDVKSEMWVYDDGVYVPNGKSEVKKIVRLILGEAFTTHFSSEVIAKVEADTYINSSEFFGNNYIDEVPVLNGILNLRTRELKPFNPEQIFFNKLPVHYNPSATCPNIDKHFRDVLKVESDVEVLYEIIGFLLWKEYFIEKAIIFVGNGRNGKGKTLDLIKRFIGVLNCSSVPLSSIREDSFSLSGLFGKMVNLAGDISNTALKETGQFKESTGRDLLNAKRKFLTDLQFVNYAKHIFACNDLPLVYDSSKGFWERWVLFEFPHTFIPKSEYDVYNEQERKERKLKLLDPEHINKIASQEELDGLLIKALDGLDKVRKNKEFSYSIGSDEIKRFWIRKANSFMAFCLDNVEDGDETDYISKPRLRKCFKHYCKKHNVKPSSDKVISGVLVSEYGASDEDYRSEFIRERRWLGVKFQKNSEYA